MTDLTLANVATLVAHRSFHALVGLGPNSNAGTKLWRSLFWNVRKLIPRPGRSWTGSQLVCSDDDSSGSSAFSCHCRQPLKSLPFFKSELSAGSDSWNSERSRTWLRIAWQHPSGALNRDPASTRNKVAVNPDRRAHVLIHPVGSAFNRAGSLFMGVVSKPVPPGSDAATGAPARHFYRCRFRWRFD